MHHLIKKLLVLESIKYFSIQGILKNSYDGAGAGAGTGAERNIFGSATLD
jgi:hypothetical protein